MKIILLITLLSLAVYTNALSLEDLIEREVINGYESADSNEDENESGFEGSLLSEMFGKRDASSANRERLKQCIKCVGVERGKGKNVKNSAAYCNNICKRGVQFQNFRPAPQPPKHNKGK